MHGTGREQFDYRTCRLTVGRSTASYHTLATAAREYESKDLPLLASIRHPARCEQHSGTPALGGCCLIGKTIAGHIGKIDLPGCNGPLGLLGSGSFLGLGLLFLIRNFSFSVHLLLPAGHINTSRIPPRMKGLAWISLRKSKPLLFATCRIGEAAQIRCFLFVYVALALRSSTVNETCFSACISRKSCLPFHGVKEKWKTSKYCGNNHNRIANNITFALC